MSSNTVYVITGASRGVGLGLAQAYIARPSTTVIGIVRNESSATALLEAMGRSPKGENSVLHVVHVDFSMRTTPQIIRNRVDIAAGNLNYVNTVICAAGHVTTVMPSVEMTAEHLRECFEINTIGPLMVLQALRDLLEKGNGATGLPPKFIVLSSSMGSIGQMEPFPGGAYGPSKAAVNHITKSIHLQMAQSGIVSVALHPGWVQTKMGEFMAKAWNYEAGPPDTLEDSVKGVIAIIDEASRDKFSGKFVTQTGVEIPW
ncbi:aflatoxin biosynthesis ketoreductase nor-1 [Nannizzia gypsea CBS 118893]|uniref:Aflatoxin biosynthesis ketoreductase nor-1 n=1 Tax=Arthroderma gypseum (strain ATCC MYA-4604 / CBS 118893) TaxID=535722 RepID=E4UZU4_ARTGP|nr:aflatoxin biosynthesis ketoreductase nor-1 [Nannizzia gypsea CBS 118893]EFR02881.1 aflatoxin biosynthesis ketoreductase nor-1 [Nannizzia gypsea CBS 118893]